ncbi:Nonribosomal Peptide Synthase (NRPS) [Aspergillus melleus]|uniref:Nonribosomal Peptide Synthase (NRPS) n=1 Tax=Aspergillus melleus TaxID=138277 RepID=A0ACC3BBU9_9EURO|nr:Nonribosomal Peptide Synthase (NRPS) [Aspergillus melleus]
MDQVPIRAGSPAAIPFTTKDTTVEVICHAVKSESDSERSTAGSTTSRNEILTRRSPVEESSGAITSVLHFNVGTQSCHHDGKHVLMPELQVSWAIFLSQYHFTEDVIFGIQDLGKEAAGQQATHLISLRLTSEDTILSLFEQLERSSERKVTPDILTTVPNAPSHSLLSILRIAAPGTDIEPLLSSSRPGTSPYDLSFICTPTPQGLTIHAKCNARVMSKAQLDSSLHKTRHLYTQIQEHRPHRIQDISPSPEDWSLVQSLDGAIPEDMQLCAHEIIHVNALLRPEAPAVAAWDAGFSYRELDMHAAQLAAQLSSCGVSSGTFIPLLFHKTRWTTVAMLGVLKAGGAFVLMDPSHPVDRLRGICSSAEAVVIVASAANADVATKLCQTVVVVGDDDDDSSGEKWKCARHAMQIRKAGPLDPMYAQFTSGSTGTPKGAVVSHSAWLSAIIPTLSPLGLDRRSRMLQFAAYAFDSAIAETLWTLVAGGCVCVPSEEHRQGRLMQAMEELEVNIAILTPSVARSLDPTRVSSLKRLLFCGEAMKTSDIELWRPHVDLMNGYGPAECAIMATICAGVNEVNDIGRCLGGVPWIVDPMDSDRLVSLGAVGELLIEGPLVGMGYLNEPEKTAAAFIDQPVWLKRLRGKATRVYKTGDLVRYSPAGSLQYVGRKDTQVKIHGQRIELGEVESHVQELFPDMQAVVAEVITPGSAPFAPILAAFLLPAGACPSQDKCGPFGRPTERFVQQIHAGRRVLQAALPQYMIPALFIPLVYLPLSLSGKLDRRMLREAASQLSRPELESLSSLGVPRAMKQPVVSDAEKTLQALFAQILDIQAAEIGADDDFLRLGGNSISAMTVVAPATERGISLSVADLVSGKTLRELAARSNQPMVALRADIPPFALLPAGISRDGILALIATDCHIGIEQIEDVYPCTPLQEGFLAMGSRETGKYIATYTHHLADEIDLERFHAAINAAANANPILRTRVIYADDRLYQVVVQEPVAWDVYDTYEAYERRATRMNMGLNERLMHLGAVLPQFPGQACVLHVQIHHALHDAWSINELWNQVERAYRGGTLPSRPYSCFIHYCLSQSAEPTVAEEVWRAQFRGLEAANFPPLPSSTYVPRPDQVLKSSLTTPPTTVLARHTISTAIRLAWAMTIATLADSDDVVFGVTVNGRSAPVASIENVSGPTIATVPLRVSIDDTKPITDLLTSVQETTLSITHHEQYGLQRIRTASPEAAVACQFQSHLGVQPPPSVAPQSGQLVSRVHSKDIDYTAFASYAWVILCHLRDSKGSAMDISVNYDSRLFDSREAGQIVSLFEYNLSAILTHSEKPLCKIPRVSPSDWHKLSVWNGNLPSPVESSVHDLVLRHAAIDPDNLAVEAWDGSWTYADLAIQSHRIAQALLQGDQLRPGQSMVPVCMSKSKWVPVAMLAVLRTGAAVVCIDPKHPPDRISQILRQVNPSVALASAGNDTEAFRAAGVAVLEVASMKSTQNTTGREDNTTSQLPAVAPSDAAFIVFTSGSTGQPKGIIMEHRNISTSIAHHSGPMKTRRATKGLHFASYAFDSAIYEIFTLLVSGACVCIPSEETRTNGIESFIQRHAVEWAVFSPSMFKILDPDRVPSLRTVTLGGEAVSRDIVAQWAPRLHLINGYGPAEATICAAGRLPAQGWTVGTIGPVVGGVGWVTKPSDPECLLPVGAAGELLVEGAVVTRGYLGRPDLTAEKYIAAPAWLREFRHRHAATPGRVFRTGDLVTLSLDGEVRFLGRKDTQVKLRGQRIELAEVEFHAGQCLGGVDVAAETVQMPDSKGGSAALVVFVVDHAMEAGVELVGGLFSPPTPTFRASIRAAEAALRDVVPGYMVPSVFLPVSKMPLTPSEKVDRKRLREAVSRLTREDINAYTSSEALLPLHPDGGTQAPRTDMEDRLHAIWAEVLRKESGMLGSEDDFFQLGGDSITAMQMASRCTRVGIPLTVTAIFQHRNIASLAAELERTAEAVAMDHTRHRAEVEEDVVFDLSPIQQLFFDKVGRHVHHFNQALFLKLRRPVSSVSMREALHWVVEKHAMLRARFTQDPTTRTWAQVISNDIPGSCRLRLHTDVSERDWQNLCDYSQKSLNIETGPLMAADLFHMADGSQALSLIAHHLVVDNVSWFLILDDLEMFFTSGSAPTAQDAISMPFQAWCRIQRERCQSLPPAPDLDAVTPSMADYWGVKEKPNCVRDIQEASFTLDPQSTASLLDAANQAFRTRPVELLHAALLYSFGQTFPDRSPPTIFSEGHGRDAPDLAGDLTGTVGWFTDIWPAAGLIQREDSMGECIRKVKDGRRHAQETYQGRWLPNRCRRSRDPAHDIEVLFNYSGSSHQTQQPDSFFHRQPLPDHELSTLGRDSGRFSLIDVSAEVEHGRFRFLFLYNRYMNPRSAGPRAIEHWAQACQRCLVQIATELPSARRQLTPADLPRLRLSSGQWDVFVRQVLDPLAQRRIQAVDAYPCTPMQQGMLACQVLSPTVYLNRLLWRVAADGDIDIPRLSLAWRQVVERQPLLRTIFAPGPGENLVQVVVHGMEASIALLELPPRRDPLQALKDFRQPWSPSPMDLPHRLTICYATTATGQTQVACLLDVAHTIIDGASRQVLFNDLRSCYAVDSGPSREAPAGRLDHVFPSYIDCLDTRAASSAGAYWEEYLEDASPCIFPPQCPKTQSEAVGARILGHLTTAFPATTHPLLRFCRQHGLTQATVLQLAWALVLRAYTHQNDVCFGFLTAGRDLPIAGIQDSVGPFINILCARFHLPNGIDSAPDSLLALLEQRQAEVTSCMQHQWAPVVDISRRVARSAQPHAQTLFNTAMSVQRDIATEEYQLPTSTLHYTDFTSEAPTEYPILLNISLREHEIALSLDYHLMEFSPAFVESLLERFCGAIDLITGGI